MRIIEKQNSRLIGEFPVVAIAATAPRAGAQHSVIFQCQHAGVAHIEKKLTAALKPDEVGQFPISIAGSPTTTGLRTIGANDIDLAASLSATSRELLASKAQFKLTIEVSIKYAGDSYIDDKGVLRTFAEDGVMTRLVEVQPLTEVDEIRVLRASAALLAMTIPTETGRAKRDTAPVMITGDDDTDGEGGNVDDEIAAQQEAERLEAERLAEESEQS